MADFSSDSPPCVRTKICGISTVEMTTEAVRLGADAIGLVMYPPSPRHVELQRALEIKAALPPFVALVVVLRNAEAADIDEILAVLQPDYLQFHGDESPAECQRWNWPYIKAVPMGAGADVLAYAKDFSDAAALLLDSHGGGNKAGQGKRFDWQKVPAKSPVPLILAGGLNPENVADAIAAVKPYAVDVSSGVESKAGQKDPARMAAFFAGVSSSGDTRLGK